MEEGQGGLLGAGGSNGDAKCTKILPATSAAPKYKFVMPTEFVMKHMSHLIEKQLQLVDDSDRSFPITLIQRRNKDKFEYMLSGWRKYGDVNQIKEGDTVLFEMLNPQVLKVSVISHGAPVPRAAKVKRKRLTGGTESEDDDDDYDLDGPSQGPPGWPPAGGGAAGLSALAGMQQQSAQAAAAAARAHSPPLPAPSPVPRRGGQALTPFEAAAQGLGPLLDPRDGPGGAGPGGPGGLLGGINPQRQATTPADQLAAALTAVQQLELPPAELLALMHGHSNAAHGLSNALSELAPLPSSDLLALMQQQMMAAGGGEPGGGGSGKPGGGGGGAGGLQGLGSLSPLQPTMAELAAVVNQLEKQARGEAPLQPADNAPAWEVLLQENVQLREDLQQWKAKVASLHSTVAGMARAVQAKTDPGLVAMTGVFNAINQIEAPDFLPDMPPRPRAVVAEVLGELRAQLNAVLHMVWEVRQLSDQLSKEIGMDEAVSALAKSHGGGPGGMPNGL